MRRMVFGLAPWVVLMACACGDPPPGNGDQGVALCTNDAQCSDGLFCNGTEACAPASADADARGCIAGQAPCDTCDEVSDECGACETPDADGDGVDAVACGGADCDDADANRFPGNPEVCDPEGHDEDCDDVTVAGADGDVDGDGFISATCCNGTGPTQVCGDDCDDGRISVFPNAAEVCNLRDDDCDVTVDEQVLETFYRDVDGDLFGVDTMTTLGCTAPTGFTFASGDCDDANPARNPGNMESCDNLIDDNCMGGVNEGCMCVGSESRPCLGAAGLCANGLEICGGGTFSACSVSPQAEVCGDGLDQDCDGTTDDEILVGQPSVFGAATLCEQLSMGPSNMIGSFDMCSTEEGVIDRVFVSLGSVATSRGAYYATPATLGYAELRFAPRVRIFLNSFPDLRAGFAIVLAEDPPGEFAHIPTELGPSVETGAPRTRHGLAVQWTFESLSGETEDRIEIRLLTGSASSSPLLAACTVPSQYHVDRFGPELTEPPIEVRYRPANSVLGVGSRFEVALVGTDFTCATADAALPAWGFGDLVYVGVTGSTVNTSNNGPFVSWAVEDDTGALAGVELDGSCP